ncbi:hypothetical protein JHN59_08560 [Streptomyces sp. MBT49]|uniref:hypothetical protein n=1 Tax=unclassified Streptomyces TaxID=2593676 RepID=UPI00190D3AB9|nr:MULTISPECIES: hypothetical protein [unclassified Streptomyces]MBK3624898.1 hypothetical protein [Streptomyces sp. MBT49]MBK3632542.1 hypothetical protein [Streptomyces sp. MBT97]
MEKFNSPQGTQEAGGSAPAQSTQQNAQTASAEPDSFAKKGALAAIRGAFGGTFRGLVSWARDTFTGDDGGTDV